MSWRTRDLNAFVERVAFVNREVDSPHPPLAVSVARSWEDAFGVVLPDEYRDIICGVANGGVGPTKYPLYSLAYALFSSRLLDGRFPLSGPVINGDDVDIETARQSLAGKGGRHLERLRRFEFGTDECCHDMTTGCLEVGHSGCGLDYFLVCDPRSACRGQVWLSCNEGCASVAEDFATWYEAGVLRAKIAWNRPSNVERAIEALDVWVGLVQRTIERELRSVTNWTRSLVSEVRREVLDGPLLQWERDHALSLVATAHQSSPVDAKLATARAWAELVLDRPGLDAAVADLTGSEPEDDFLRAELAARRENQEAIRITRAGLARSPRSAILRNALAIYLSRLGQAGEADAIQGQLALCDPWPSRWTYSERPVDDKYLNYGRAVAAVARDDVDAAVEWVARAIDAGVPAWWLAISGDLERLHQITGYTEILSGGA